MGFRGWRAPDQRDREQAPEIAPTGPPVPAWLSGADDSADAGAGCPGTSRPGHSPAYARTQLRLSNRRRGFERILRRMARSVGSGPLVAAALALACGAGCRRRTGELPDARAAQLAAEGIVRRADDLTFRRTHRPGTARSTWDKKLASLVVTRQTVLLHVNGKPLVEITPRSTGHYDVHRDHDRLQLHAGSGASATSWSFRPPDDAEGWAKDIRAVIRGGAN